MYFWHWCVTLDPGGWNWVSALRIVQTLTSRTKMKRQELKNTEMWHTWFMGHIMAVWGLAAEKGKQAVSNHFGGEKALGWLQLRMVPSLSVHNFSTLSLFVSFFLATDVLPLSLLSPASLHFYCISFSLSSLLSFCLPSAFPGCSLQYFTELYMSVA